MGNTLYRDLHNTFLSIAQTLNWGALKICVASNPCDTTDSFYEVNCFVFTWKKGDRRTLDHHYSSLRWSRLLSWEVCSYCIYLLLENWSWSDGASFAFKSTMEHHFTTGFAVFFFFFTSETPRKGWTNDWSTLKLIRFPFLTLRKPPRAFRTVLTCRQLRQTKEEKKKKRSTLNDNYRRFPLLSFV